LISGGIRAFHSSPHDFERFDLSKIGTGEGAQVYGHGLYFAENPAVSGQGGQYWNQFLQRFEGTPEAAAAQRLKEVGFDRAKAIEAAQRDFENARSGSTLPYYQELKALQSGKPVGPRTYEVNINADPAHFLDWDKGLHRQSPEVQEALARQLGIKADPAGMAAHDDALHRALTSFTDTNIKIPKQPYDPTGAEIYRNKIGPATVATRQLNEAGIPGIKYLDQGSRAPPARFGALFPDPSPTPTSNYVVFNDKLIDILKKYGIAGLAPAGMGALAAQDQYQPEERM
jgi:hypothetical protein